MSVSAWQFQLLRPDGWRVWLHNQDRKLPGAGKISSLAEYRANPHASPDLFWWHADVPDVRLSDVDFQTLLATPRGGEVLVYVSLAAPPPLSDFAEAPAS